MNRTFRHVAMALALAALVVGGAQAQDQESDEESYRPSWRSQTDTPERPELPPEIDRPEMEFNIERSAFERPEMDARSLAPVSRPSSDSAPDLGRVATWRERRAAAAQADAAAEAAPVAEEVAEIVASPEPTVSPVATDTAVASLGPAPEPVLDLDVATPSLAAESDAAASRLRPVTTVAPDYPRDAYLNRDEGWVDVEFSVNPDGSVESVRVVDAKPRRTFEKAALRAANGWRFAPAPGGQSGTFRFEFNMDG